MKSKLVKNKQIFSYCQFNTKFRKISHVFLAYPLAADILERVNRTNLNFFLDNLHMFSILYRRNKKGTRNFNVCLLNNSLFSSQSLHKVPFSVLKYWSYYKVEIKQKGLRELFYYISTAKNINVIYVIFFDFLSVIRYSLPELPVMSGVSIVHKMLHIGATQNIITLWPKVCRRRQLRVEKIHCRFIFLKILNICNLCIVPSMHAI